MAKLSGSYESVVRGVSEQAPQNRRSGQHFAQVNMISDPVRGLARRHGSILQDEVSSGVLAQDWETLQGNLTNYKTVPFFVGGTEYDLVLRTGPDAGTGDKGFVWAFNKENRKFIPVKLQETALTDPVMSALIANGASAWVNIGRYVMIAANGLKPLATVTDAYGGNSNKNRAAVWIRGGAYSRTFKIRVTQNGEDINGVYKTVSSSYPGSLDTSDIPLYIGTELNPNYQKQINDRVNAYNSAVAQWVGTAAADITPENIAQKLVEDLVSKGINAFRAQGHVFITETSEIEVTSDDGGDQSLMVAVGNEIDNIDLVSTLHYVGKIVKVVPDDPNADAIYLKAQAKDGVSTGYTDVVWRETAGYIMQPSTVFAIGTVEDGVFYLAGSPAELTALTGVEVPEYKANKVGDDLSAPLPEFFGRGIDYLGLFQDRLVVGSGATLMFSRPGDYFNWFRKSIATVYDDDPWEGYALGSEDDTIKWSTTYDRNLLLYGKRFQYSVSGRQPLTPKTASIVTSSSFEDATDAAPKATGNYVIYSKWAGLPGREVTSLHQVQAGIVADNPESTDISQQLDTLLSGIPLEIVPLTSPNIVLLRTSKHTDRVFTYSYIDGPQQERLFDSWSPWVFSTSMGHLIGVSKDGGDIIMYFLRFGKDATGVDTVWVASEMFSRDSGLSDYPYLDSLRPFSAFTAEEAYLNPANGPLSACSVAIAAGEDKQFVGLSLDRWEEFQQVYSGYAASSWVGVNYDAYVTPTNPFAKDRNDQPILAGRLTLVRIEAAVADTGGMEAFVTIRNQPRKKVVDFAGRLLGAPANLLGTQPIATGKISATIGAEVRECSYTLAAKTWLPLTITSIDWTGQFFFNSRRA